MSEVRDFDAEFGLDEKEGLAFKMGGQEFRTKPVAPLKAFRADFGGGMDSAISFISLTLVAEDRERFQALVEDPDSLLSPFQVAEVAKWLIEETMGRPTVPPASSENGSGATDDSSKDASSSPVATGG